jgi:hypothetical protein
MRVALASLVMLAMMVGSASAQSISFAEAARMCVAYVTGSEADLGWTPSREWRRLFTPSTPNGPHSWVRDAATASNPRGAWNVDARQVTSATPDIQRRSCAVHWWLDAEPNAVSDVNRVLAPLRFSGGYEPSYMGSWSRFDENAFFEVYLSAHEQQGAWTSTLLFTSTRLPNARIVPSAPRQENLE